jgi:aldehyde dehydrogenase (NAD+)
MYIDGERLPAASGGTFAAIDPATGKSFAAVADGGPADIARAVAAAREAVGSRAPALEEAA